MSAAELLLLALGLALDATAVAALRGMAASSIGARELALVALVFGGSHALAPLLGSLAGARLGSAIESVHHWVAWALLCGVGVKLLWDARASRPAQAVHGDPFAVGTLCVLALALSVDALAIGVTLPLLGTPALPAALAIGLTTALLASLGLYAGRRFGALLGRRLELVGGLALIGLGFKILVEHLRAH